MMFFSLPNEKPFVASEIERKSWQLFNKTIKLMTKRSKK